MEQKTLRLLFALLRSAVGGKALTAEERGIYSVERLPELLEISSKHDVAHLVSLGLKQNDLISQGDMSIKKNILVAAYRHEQLRREYETLCNALEKAQIPFLPLKGSVIRQYYREPWMRTSCDIDVLVHEEDLDRAVSMLVEEQGYTYRGKGSHDASLFAPNKIHIELHFNLMEDGIAQESSAVLKNVWETAECRPGWSFFHEMPDEMFYFYHISHMAKHFENGGCGIRPLIDLWILDSMQDAQAGKRDALLAQGKLLRFANAIRKLSKIWFDCAEYDPVSKQMEDYILYGGVYGNSENRITLQQSQKGGRLRYALSKVFIPYDVIKFHYPILQKRPWLMPLMQIRRWGKLAFCGHAKRSIRELRYNSSVANEKAAQMQAFLENIGL